MRTTHLPTGRVTPEDPASYLSEITARIHAEQQHTATAINLVPSENRMSPAAHAMLATDYSNRYHFNETRTRGQWEFRGGEAVADLELAGRQAFSRLTGADFVNLRPISGLNATLIALAGLGGDPGSTVVSIAPACGGHYATGTLIGRLGYRWAPVDCLAGRIDLDQLARALADREVSLVYLDLQNSRHILDVAAVAEVLATHPGTRLHVDCSHTMGLVLGGAHPNPLDHGAGSAGGSLHKSFPGPHHGVLFTRDAQTAMWLRDAQFFLVSSHHFGCTLAAAVTALEFQTYGSGYAQSVIANARALAAALAEQGFDVAGAHSGFTETHQVWVRVDDAAGLSDRLAQWGIRVNVQTGLPGCPGRMWRLGAAEPTVLGATATDMGELATVIACARDGQIARGRACASELRQRIGQCPWWSRASEPEGAML
jgi:glycine hydroxymethyltransferase